MDMRVWRRCRWDRLNLSATQSRFVAEDPNIKNFPLGAPLFFRFSFTFFFSFSPFPFLQTIPSPRPSTSSESSSNNKNNGLFVEIPLPMHQQQHVSEPTSGGASVVFSHRPQAKAQVNSDSLLTPPMSPETQGSLTVHDSFSLDHHDLLKGCDLFGPVPGTHQSLMPLPSPPFSAGDQLASSASFSSPHASDDDLIMTDEDVFMEMDAMFLDSPSANDLALSADMAHDFVLF
ncbi:hypothetical protein BC940DRAFT_302878, partial [Gongronella butleri]